MKDIIITKGLINLLKRLTSEGDIIFSSVAYIDMEGVLYLLNEIQLEKLIVFFSKVIPYSQEHYDTLVDSPLWQKVYLLHHQNIHHHEKLYVIISPDQKHPPITIHTSANLTLKGLTENIETAIYSWGTPKHITNYFHLLGGTAQRVFPFVKPREKVVADTIDPFTLTSLLEDIKAIEAISSLNEDNLSNAKIIKINGQIKDAVRIIGGYIAGEKGRFIISEPGTGKTIISGMALRYLLENKMAQRVLIVTKKNILFQWRDELQEKFDIKSIHLKNNNLHIISDEKPIVAITTYQFLLHHHGILSNAKWDIVIFDESDYRMAHDIKTKRVIQRWHSNVRFTLLLTATPVRRSVDDLFTQMEFITSKEEISVLKQLVDLGKASPFITLSITRRTLQDLGVNIPQDHHYHDVNITLQETERKLFHTVRSISGHAGNLFLSHPLLLLSYPSGKSIDSNLLKTIKNTFQRYEDYSPFAKTLELVKKHVDKEENIVMFVKYRETGNIFKSALAKLGIPSVFLHGNSSDEERKNYIKNLGKSHKVLILVRGVMEGLNLQTANVLINYDMPPNYGTLVQRIGRIYRIGQDKATYIYTIVVKNTPIEERYRRLKELKDKLKNIIPEGVLDQIVVLITEEKKRELDESYNDYEIEKEISEMAEATSDVYKIAQIATLIEDFEPPDIAFYSQPLTTPSSDIQFLKHKHFIAEGFETPLYIVQYNVNIGNVIKSGYILWDGKSIVENIPEITETVYIKELQETYIPQEDHLKDLIASRYSELLTNFNKHIDSILEAYTLQDLPSEIRENMQIAMSEHISASDIKIDLSLWSIVG